MPKASPNAPCPCGSGAKYKKCCGPFHRGKPAEPRRLMRARYCAYAIGEVRYLMQTTHPDGPMHRDDSAAWSAELEDYCGQTTFTGLTIHEHGVEETSDAFVTFTAQLEHAGAPSGFTERSRFRRHGTRWKYYDGTPISVP